MNTFLAIHGNWFGGWYWDDVAERIEHRGYPTAVVDRLPSVGADPSNLGDLTADAAHLRRHIDAIDGPVTLVGHSSGGMVMTEVADHPAVRHSVYVTAFWPEAGQALLDLIGGGPLPDWMAARDDGTVQISDDLEAVRQALFAELDRNRAADVHRRLMLSSAASMATPSTAPDRGHPTTYVICEHDQAIPPAAQEAMAAKADHVIRLATSHCPMLVMPRELASLVMGATVTPDRG